MATAVSGRWPPSGFGGLFRSGKFSGPDRTVARYRFWLLASSLRFEGHLLVTATFPSWAIGKIELFKGFGSNSNAVAGLFRRHVTSIADHDRIEKMLMQMIDIFDHPVFKRSRQANVVEQGNVLDIFA